MLHYLHQQLDLLLINIYIYLIIRNINFFGFISKLLLQSHHTCYSNQWRMYDPRGRGANPGGGGNIQFCQIFPKLHEIERIWIPGVPRAPLDPLMPLAIQIEKKFKLTYF